MSQPAVKSRDSAAKPPGARHDQDLYTWVQEQVALLRAGRLAEIDAENIAEELADVGRSEYRELQSALALILTHLLKWDHQPEKRTRSWENTIKAQRQHYANALEDSPGLKSRREEALTRAYSLACLAASSETGLSTSSFPAECSYGWDEILERPFANEAPPSSGRKR